MELNATFQAANLAPDPIDFRSRRRRRAISGLAGEWILLDWRPVARTNELIITWAACSGFTCLDEDRLLFKSIDSNEIIDLESCDECSSKLEIDDPIDIVELVFIDARLDCWLPPSPPLPPTSSSSLADPVWTLLTRKQTIQQSATEHRANSLRAQSDRRCRSNICNSTDRSAAIFFVDVFIHTGYLQEKYSWVINLVSIETDLIYRWLHTHTRTHKREQRREPNWHLKLNTGPNATTLGKQFRLNKQLSSFSVATIIHSIICTIGQSILNWCIFSLHFTIQSASQPACRNNRASEKWATGATPER